MPYRILVLGGAGFVVGLATFGYKIMSVLGASPKLLHWRQRTCFWRAVQAACINLRHSLPLLAYRSRCCVVPLLQV